MQAPEPTNHYGKTFAIIAWLIVMVLLYLFFQDTIDKQLNPNSQLNSVQGSRGETRTVLIRNKSGHYVGTALLNNQPVDFMLDTGATTVAIAASTAEKLGLPLEKIEGLAVLPSGEVLFSTDNDGVNDHGGGGERRRQPGDYRCAPRGGHA